MSATVLAPGEGEVISDYVKIKVGREEFALTESHYPSGRQGPGPHIHRQHADCFYVLGGELTFGVGPGGGEVHKAGPGTFVHVPPEVVHTFRNEGPAEAHFLNIHAPGQGFDDYMRAARDGDEAAQAKFDSFDEPEDGGRPASEALVLGPDEGDEVVLGPSAILIKVGKDHGLGGLTFCVGTVGAGFPGPPLHVHDEMVDSFFVLEGTLTIRTADGDFEAEPGTYVMVPPETVHSFANPADSPVRVLNIMAPGGLEAYFREAAAALPAGTPPDPELLGRLASKYDFRPVS